METEEQIKLLLELSPDVNEERARRVLHKHKGNVDAAAHALLEGDHGEEIWPINTAEFGGKGALNVAPRNTPERDTVHLPPRYAQSKSIAAGGSGAGQQPVKDNEAIDLTGDEDMDAELKKAIALSLEDEKSRPNETADDSNQSFRRSDRAPDPEWAMVSTNNPVTNQSELQLMQAIEASLSQREVDERYEELHGEELIRSDDRPIALRTREGHNYFAALVLQALFYVPQVRQNVARWKYVPSMGNNQVELGAQEYITFNLVSLFTHMDLTARSALELDELMSGFNLKQANSTDPPGELSNDLYSTLAYALDSQLSPESSVADTKWHRIFHLRYSNTSSSPNSAPLNRRSDTACVRVDISLPNSSSNEPSDLVSCLAQQLSLNEAPENPNSNHLVLVEPSDVVAFQLVRQPPPQTAQTSPQNQAASTVKKATFKFPPYVYLDQFLRENDEVASRKRAVQRAMADEIRMMVNRREKLSYHEGSSVHKNLVSALYYYENVALKEGQGPIRAAQMRDVTLKLRKIVARVENEVQALEGRIATLQKEYGKVFDDPSLQQFRYDLRAVLFHDGLYGRNHTFSYVKHNGRWWKTVDYHVTETTEEVVLNDTTGLHLDAGPYMLIYSRAINEQNIPDVSTLWPIELRESALGDANAFISSLPTEIAEGVRRQRAERFDRILEPAPASNEGYMENLQTRARTKSGARQSEHHMNTDEKRATSREQGRSGSAMDIS